MDGTRFDDWITKLTTGGGTRRLAVRLLAGGVLGGVLARLGVEDAAAGCVRLGKTCERRDRCCDGGRCKGGRCTCAAGEIRAGRQCVTGRGTCQGGNDSCSGTVAFTCNGNSDCVCLTTMAGATRCGTSFGLCDACSVDSDCGSHGAGAFCMRKGSHCCTFSTATGVCALPCPG